MDIENLKQNENIELMKGKIIYTFSTVSDMTQSNSMKAGNYARTLGYYSEGKGGGMYYITSSTQTVDNIRIFKTANNLYAILIDNGNVDSYGAKGDGTTDDSARINAAILHNMVIRFGQSAVYLCNSQITIRDDRQYFGNGCTIKTTTSTQIQTFYANGGENYEIRDFIFNVSFRAIFFQNCRHIKLDNITVTSTNWGITFRQCRNVVGKNLMFNQPIPTGTDYNNTDAIHINGLIQGEFTNIIGYAGDDMIALNADESTDAIYGDIRDVEFNNVDTSINTNYGFSHNGSYRNVKFLAFNSYINNIRFNGCKLMNSANKKENIIFEGNSNHINNIFFNDCVVTNYASTFMCNFISNVENIVFSNCRLINNSYGTMFTCTSNINNIIFDNIILENNFSGGSYLLNLNSASIGNVILHNIYGNDVNDMNLVILRGGTTSFLKIDGVNFSSSANWLIQTAGGTPLIVDVSNITSKVNNNGILYLNTNKTSTDVFLSNINPELLGVSSFRPARIVGGTANVEPSAPLNGDYYYYKSGNAVTLKLYSNGAWKNLN